MRAVNACSQNLSVALRIADARRCLFIMMVKMVMVFMGLVMMMVENDGEDDAD